MSLTRGILRLQALLGHVSGIPAHKTQFVVEAALPLLRGEFAIITNLWLALVRVLWWVGGSRSLPGRPLLGQLRQAGVQVVLPGTLLLVLGLTGYGSQLLLQGIMGVLLLVLPVPSIDALAEGVEAAEQIGFPNPGDLILDPVREAMIIVVPEGILAPPESCGDSIELHVVLRDPFGSLHGEVVEFCLGVRNWVVQTEVDAEFLHELLPVRCARFIGGFSKQDWLKELQGCALQE